MARFVVVLDANVLYGIAVTDLMATMATRRLFRPHWSAQILDEVTRNLDRRPDLDSTAVARRIDYLNRALPDALAAIPDSLIEAMPINDKDRHVLALAVHVGAQVVVTDNLKDSLPNSSQSSASRRSAQTRSRSPRSTSTVRPLRPASRRWLPAVATHR